MRSPPLMVLNAVPVVMLETLNAVLVVKVACFAESAVATSPTPVRLMLLVALSVEAATEATLNAVLVVSVACLPLNAVTTLVPATVNDPPIVAFPATATVEFKKAAPSACSSRLATISRPRMSPFAVTPALQTTLATDSCDVDC